MHKSDGVWRIVSFSQRWWDHDLGRYVTSVDGGQPR